MSLVTDSMRSGIGALNNFGAVLSTLLESFDNSMLQCNENNNKLAKNLEDFRGIVDAHETRLGVLETETAEQRRIVENAMKQMLGIEKNVDVALADATRHLHKEILAQRTMTKMDISQLRGKMHHSMSEAMNLLSDGNSRAATAADMAGLRAFASGLSPHDEADDGSDKTSTEKSGAMGARVRRLEEAVGLQHTINLQLQQNAGNDEVIQRVYDQLFEEIQQLHGDLAKARSDTSGLRRLVAEMKVRQDWQDKQIADLLRALNDKSHMTMLRTEIHNGQRDLPKPVFVAPLDPEAIAAEERDRKRMRKLDRQRKRILQKKRRALRNGEEVVEEEGEAEDAEGNDEDEDEKAVDEVGESQLDGDVQRSVPGSRKRSAKRKEIKAEEEVEVKVVVETGPDDSGAVPPESASASANYGNEDEHMYGEDDESSVFFEDSASLMSFMHGTAYDPDANRGLDAASQELLTQLQERVTALESAGAEDKEKELLQQRVTELEVTVSTFKRIAFVIDDLKNGFETVKTKVDKVTGGESIDEQHLNSIGAKLKALQIHWKKVLAELCFALEAQNDADLDPHGNNTSSNGGGGDKLLKKKSSHIHLDAADNNHSDSNLHLNNEADEADNNGEKRFFLTARDFAVQLEDFLSLCDAQDSTCPVPRLLNTLSPRLDLLYDAATHLLQLDDRARNSEALEHCFDDLLCSDLTPSLRQYVEEGAALCLPILDQTQHTALLKKQLQDLTQLAQQKADRIQVLESDRVTRGLLAQKVDSAEFKAVTGRLASAAELQRLQQQLNEGKVAGAGVTGGYGNNGHRPQSSAGAEGLLDEEILRESPLFQQQVSKTEALASLLRDLQQHSERLVGKEEVAEALKAVILEVKSLRKNSVSQAVFKEALTLKADAKEVDKLLRQLAGVLGEANLSAQELQALGGLSSAAFHAKCLLCDKPVTQQKQRAIVTSASTPLLHPAPNTSDSTSFALPAIKPQSSSGARARLVSEVAVLRTALTANSEPNDVHSSARPQSQEALSQLHVNTQHHEEFTDVLPSPAAHHSNNSVPHVNPAQQQQQNYKQRIRASAGGGMGPGFKQDTR